MPDTLFGGPGRTYDETPAASPAFAPPAPAAAEKPVDEKAADETGAAEKPAEVIVEQAPAEEAH